MIFCKVCNGILTFVKGRAFCAYCKIEQEGTLSSSEELSKLNEVAMINEKEEITLPKIENTCKRCGHEWAYFWHMNSIGDEAEVVYYQCVKCSHTVQQGGQRGGR